MLTNAHLLLDSISDGILMLDKDAYIRYTNPAIILTGYNGDELLSRPLSLLYPNEEDPIRVSYELEMTLKKGIFHSEGWKRKKDGSLFWADMTFAPAYDEQGNHAGFSCVIRDNTEKKKEDVLAVQKGDRYRLMVESVRDYAIFQLDAGGHVVTWNEGAARIKGYSSREIIGRHFSTFYTKEDLDIKKPENELKIAIATGKYEEEGWRVKKNGSVFWASVVITALFNEQNQLVGFSKVTRDLTERKFNEEALRQSEERYRLLVEQVLDYGIFMLDDKGRIISWNEGARKIKGYETHEILGKYFSIFYPEEDILNGKPAYELKVASSEGKYEEEGWRLRKDGSRFWASVVITAVYNAEGILIGYSKVTRDLTERKESEKALRESYERYRMLAEQLHITNEELSYANQELEQFTSIVSHDLQEPVRTIKSFLQLIDMKVNDAQYDTIKSYITKSINAANRMKELIQNLLQYSQLSRGELVEEEVNVEEVFTQVLQNLKSSIDNAGAQVIVENEVSTIMGNSMQMVQLIQNLLSNAIKFTDNQKPVIRLRCWMENDQAKFSVSDNGIGIAESDAQKIFEIFRRLNTKKDYPGTGIGLAICKKIVDRHGGRIWPESKPGIGTTFYFTLSDENKGITVE